MHDKIRVPAWVGPVLHWSRKSGPYLLLNSTARELHPILKAEGLTPVLLRDGPTLTTTEGELTLKAWFRELSLPTLLRLPPRPTVRPWVDIPQLVSTPYRTCWSSRKDRSFGTMAARSSQLGWPQDIAENFQWGCIPETRGLKIHQWPIVMNFC